jgi:hypothetical protein
MSKFDLHVHVDCICWADLQVFSTDVLQTLDDDDDDGDDGTRIYT